MQILANRNFEFAEMWLFLRYWVNLQVFTEISMFWGLHLQFSGPKGLRGLHAFLVAFSADLDRSTLGCINFTTLPQKIQFRVSNIKKLIILIFCEIKSTYLQKIT